MDQRSPSFFLPYQTDDVKMDDAAPKSGAYKHDNQRDII